MSPARRKRPPRRPRWQLATPRSAMTEPLISLSHFSASTAIGAPSMTVSAFSDTRRRCRRRPAAGEDVDIADMLRLSQILVLAPELTDGTRGMIDADELAALPQGAIVVNAERRQVLNLAAPADALDSGHMSTAGLEH
jgi:D-3-phosphoglycerate dehydrogenase / 2-oxoglutarate reductase